MSVSSASSYEPNNAVQTSRRFRTPSNPWLPYIGNCKALEKYLKTKEGVGWVIPKYLNALLRGISQVILANNPLAGLVILIALFWANVLVGLSAVVAATSAIITAVLMRQEPAAIAAGLTTYNAVLVGTVTASLWQPLYGEPLGIKLWSFIILGSVLSVFITSAFASMLSSLKISLPALTVPFNVVIVLVFVCLMPVAENNDGKDPVALRLQQDFSNDQSMLLSNPIRRQLRKAEDFGDKPTVEMPTDEEIGQNSSGTHDWGKILTGIILSAGQVYGVEDVLSSILIYIGIMIYSPMLFMMSVVGAIVGTIFGIFFASANMGSIYSGLWGYNALLSASSVGGLFIVFTCHSFLNALANVAFTVILQQTLIIALKSANLPVFTIPFVLSTLLFLSVSTAGNQLPRVSEITFPEMHRYIYREFRRVKEAAKQEEKLVVAGEVAEEKELVLTDVKVINDDGEKSSGVEPEDTKEDGETEQQI